MVLSNINANMCLKNSHLCNCQMDYSMTTEGRYWWSECSGWTNRLDRAPVLPGAHVSLSYWRFHQLSHPSSFHASEVIEKQSIFHLSFTFHRNMLAKYRFWITQEVHAGTRSGRQTLAEDVWQWILPLKISFSLRSVFYTQQCTFNGTLIASDKDSDFNATVTQQKQSSVLMLMLLYSGGETRLVLGDSPLTWPIDPSAAWSRHILGCHRDEKRHSDTRT